MIDDEQCVWRDLPNHGLQHGAHVDPDHRDLPAPSGWASGQPAGGCGDCEPSEPRDNTLIHMNQILSVIAKTIQSNAYSNREITI
ncbi:hypothetical protein ACVMYR_28555 [Micromonospora sp. PTRAS2]